MLVTVGLTDDTQVMSCISLDDKWILCDWYARGRQEFRDYRSAGHSTPHRTLAAMPLELL